MHIADMFATPPVVANVRGSIGALKKAGSAQTPSAGPRAQANVLKISLRNGVGGSLVAVPQIQLYCWALLFVAQNVCPFSGLKREPAKRTDRNATIDGTRNTNATINVRAPHTQNTYGKMAH